MDRFEKWVTENRSGFDIEVSSDKVWDRIEQKMAKRSRVKKRINQLSIAASIVILIGISFYSGMQYFGREIQWGEIATARESLNKIPTRKSEIIVSSIDSKPKTTSLGNHQSTTENDEKANTLLAIKETDAYYRQTLLEQREQIVLLSSNNPSVLNSVNEEFMTLDSTIKVLAKDLGENVNNLEVMQAIIQNYRLRIEMLNMMIQQLKENENENENKTIQL